MFTRRYGHEIRPCFITELDVFGWKSLTVSEGDFVPMGIFKKKTILAFRMRSELMVDIIIFLSSVSDRWATGLC